MSGGPFQKKIYFRDGVVVAAASENPKEFLGYFLVGWNYIAEDELKELLDMQERHGALLGELLVIIGRLSREELRTVLQAKSEECIFEVFLWDEGDFRFIDNILPNKKFEPLDLPVDMVVMEGVRRQDEWSRSRKVITDDRCIPKIARAIDVQGLAPRELSILGEINGSNTIEEIGLACRIVPFHVHQFLFHGLQQSLFELLPPDGEERPIPGFTAGSWRLTLKEAEQALENGDLLAAYRAIEVLLTKFQGVREAGEYGVTLRRKIEQAIQLLTFNDDSILELAISPAQLTEVSCSPEEGFLLSRISGAYTVGWDDEGTDDTP